MTTITADDLHDWLLAPTGQGGRGCSVLAAAMWLDAWDGAAVPEGFRAWAGGTLAP